MSHSSPEAGASPRVHRFQVLSVSGSDFVQLLINFTFY